jgi:hypothetical protein
MDSSDLNARNAHLQKQSELCPIGHTCLSGHSRVARWYIFIPKSHFLESLVVENFAPNLDQLVYFMVVWYILFAFGKFCGLWIYLSSFGMPYQEKSGNPGSQVGQLPSLTPTPNSID